jgi:hypothetical protein
VSALLAKFGVNARSQLSDFSTARMFNQANVATAMKNDGDGRSSNITSNTSSNKKVSYLPNRSIAAFG